MVAYAALRKSFSNCLVVNSSAPFEPSASGIIHFRYVIRPLKCSCGTQGGFFEMPAAVPFKDAVCATLCKPAVQGADIITHRSHDGVFLKKLKVRTKILLKCIAYNFRLIYNNFVNIRLLLCCERAIL